MKKILIKCDKCGREEIDLIAMARLKFENSRDFKRGVDLCGKCVGELREFLCKR